jgi:nascent polypeptide-associated complex subunit alpha
MRLITMQIEDMNSQAQLSAAQQLASGGGAGAGVPNLEDSGFAAEGEEDDIPELETPDDDGPVDESGVDAKDIELVMAQVNCSRAKAVRVLRESGGDLINASESTSVYRFQEEI